MPVSLNGQGCFMAWFELDFDKEPLLNLSRGLAQGSKTPLLLIHDFGQILEFRFRKKEEWDIY